MMISNKILNEQPERRPRTRSVLLLKTGSDGDKSKKVSRKRKTDLLSPSKAKISKRSALVDINVNAAVKKSSAAYQKQVLVSPGSSNVVNLEKVNTNECVVTSSGKLSKIRQSLDAFIYLFLYFKSSGNENPDEKTDASSSEKDESSLYISALEDLVPTPKAEETSQEFEEWEREGSTDPINVTNYATEIFQYMKSREKSFQVGDYMPTQFWISKRMRAVLVDWVVEVQQNFHLSHETLYLAVKITDLYLSKIIATKDSLQLVAVASVFIASKYDERSPLRIEDFLYICDYSFTRADVIRMEMEVFKVIGFNLCIPLSYRFLGRFARCCRASELTLFAAKYILELSLLEYHLVVVSESKLACAALYLAMRMSHAGTWTPSLEYYSGYQLSDFKIIVFELNAMLHRRPRAHMKTIRTKYSQKKVLEVAKIPLLDDFDLC